MRHPKALTWEAKLKAIFDRIDADLEARYGGHFHLRANRPAVGETANPEHDGLFNVGAAFTAGFGSKHGRGYIVEMHMATISRVPDAVREAILDEVAQRLRDALPEAFPGKKLQVSREGAAYKIHGDLSLGKV